MKVKLPSTDHIPRIFKQAKTLKQSSAYSSDFIAPDRTKMRGKTEAELWQLSEKDP